MTGGPKKASRSVETSIRHYSTEASRQADRAPDAIAGVVAAQKPRPIDNAPCNKMSIRVLRKTITFRSACRETIESINSRVKKRFEETEDKINALVAQRITDLQSGREGATEDLIDSATAQVAAEHAVYQRSVRRGLQVAVAVQYFSYIALAGALLAGFQMAIGRVLYDTRRGGAGAHATFQFEEGDPEPLVGHNLEVSSPSALTEQLHIARLSDRGSRKGVWYVALNVTRGGPGSEMDLHIPLLFRGLWQRIASNKWAMSRIVLENGADPTISSAGDSLLVAIKIKKGQRIGFRISDLAAFSDGVDISSVYCTHLGGHLLGLGSFHAVATLAATRNSNDTPSEDGYLVLRTFGMVVSNQVRGSTPGCRVVAWDRRQKFAISQASGRFGIWINEPSLVLSPSQRTMVIDEEVQQAQFGMRAWRLIRYLFLPI